MPVTLLTDFGLADSYVGQVKGAILAVAPRAICVDITHEVPPQDVRAGAFHLWAAVPAFPAGTIHLAVIDPGVGSSRRAIAARSKRGDLFVGPDNGLLVPAIERLGGLAAAVELRPSKRPSSNTFHGRDLFAPAVGRLAQGAPLRSLGPPLKALDRSIVFPEPTRRGKLLEGEVLHIDRYGNLITNLPTSLLPKRYEVRVGTRVIQPAPHYAAVRKGALLALIGSNGLLEISVREGSAQRQLRAKPGTRVTLTEIVKG
jgi:S-adenosylmethionine hydrolase